jgi:TatD DNase family protein
MNFTDTHTHLYAEEFDTDRELVMKKAMQNGVKRFYLPNVDSESISRMLDLEAKYPEICFPMIGLHPCSVNESVETELQIVKEWLGKRRFAAIGEIGLDLYWDKSFFKQQQYAFRTQLQWALEENYGVSIHCRNAFEEIYVLLKEFGTLPRIIFHCFSGNVEEAERILALGNIKLGIGGVVTFKNSGLDKVVEAINAEHFVLETDAPYLAPVPFRGKRNEAVYLLEVAKKVADLKGLTMMQLEEITNKNSDYIFKNRG